MIKALKSKYFWTHAIIVLMAVFYVSLCWAGELPNPNITIGKSRDLTLEVICTTKWGKDHRAVTDDMKNQVYVAYGLTNHVGECAQSPRGCEVDHLISRENGGADAVENLWPQHYGGACGAEKKDQLENVIHKLICSGKLAIQQGQDALSKNWIDSYAKYVDSKGCGL